MNTMEEMIQKKCKNCGAALELTKTESGVVTCEFCFSSFTLAKKQTTPRALEFLNMGEHELDVCNFDNAYKAYRKAAEECANEPEAYWGMALASARVQYLRDIVNNRLQPVCHGIASSRFTEDENYRKACALATEEQKKEYEKKAEEIERIREEFYKLKQSGLDYDCFICVKVTDGNRHTEDSVMALSLYHKLKAAGFKPFYSEEEMAGRTGADYEAMILYALYCSECMLLICTEERYLKTPWVENEYTRFIGMLHDEEKSKDSIAVVFTENPIEKIPGMRGKIQGVKYNSFDALDRIQSFVRRFAADKSEKEVREEELRRQTEDMARQMDEMRRQMEELKKGGSSAPQSPLRLYTCKVCGEKLNPNDAVDGVITCEICLAKNVIERAPAPKTVAENPSDSRFKFEKNATGYTLAKYSGKDAECEIPNTYKGEAVTRIGDSAFGECRLLTRVTVPEGVNEIGYAAFKNCVRLSEIEIPEGVTVIEGTAFSGCSSLARITIPQSLKEIGSWAFYECDNLSAADFKNPKGWPVGIFSSAKSLSDPAKAAKLLRTSLVAWERK